MTTTSSTSSTSSTAANIISALGAGSGIDTQALANSLVEAERAPRKELIDGKLTKTQAKISAYGAVKYALSQVQAAFQKLNDTADFKTLKTAVSPAGAFTASAGTKAAAGSFQIKVDQVAQAQRTGSIPFDSATTTINGGAPFTLTLTVGTEAPVEIAVATATPAGMVTAINNAGTGVMARLVNTGAGQKVVLTGEVGAAKEFTVSAQVASTASVTTQDGAAFEVSAASGTNRVRASYVDPATQEYIALELVRDDDGLWRPEDGAPVPPAGVAVTLAAQKPADLFPTPLQPAQDARIEVDGLAITRTSNTVSDVIDGVTLNLQAPTTGTTGAQLDLQRENGSVMDNLRALVTAYNDLEDTLAELANPDSKVDEVGGALAGDSFVNSVRGQVRALITQASTTPSNSVQAMRNVGLAFDRYGKLQLDEDKAAQALDENFDDVVKMFTGGTDNASVYATTPAGAAGSAVRTLDKMLRSTGIIDRQTQSASTQVQRYEDDLAALEDRMSQLLQRYIEQFAAMDSIVGDATSLRTSLANTFKSMANAGKD